MSSAFRAVIDLLSKHPRGLKDHYSACPKTQVFGRLRISATACRLLLNYKFAKTADEEVFASFEGLLDDLEERFDGESRLGFAQPDMIIGVIDDLFLRELHLGTSSTCRVGDFFVFLPSYGANME